MKLLKMIVTGICFSAVAAFLNPAEQSAAAARSAEFFLREADSADETDSEGSPDAADAETGTEGGEKDAENPADGSVKDGWYKENGKTYYYISGEKQTGMQKIDGKKYYFSPKNGQMLTGRQKIGTAAYYFNKNGVLKVSAWIYDGKKTYYAGKSGILKTGWAGINGKKYYFSSKDNNMQTGWNKISGKYYFLAVSEKGKGVLQKNCIAGTSKTGWYYVDSSGIRVTSSEIANAVKFVRKYGGSGTDSEKLKKCFQALKKYPYQRFYQNHPSAGSMRTYADYMFTQKQGNCYRYAAAFACVARVLGYESRVGIGGVSSRGPGTSLNPHGWAEIKKGGTWYLCDISMQKHHPSVSLYMRTWNAYPFQLRCDARYTLSVKNGGVSWK